MRQVSADGLLVIAQFRALRSISRVFPCHLEAMYHKVCFFQHESNEALSILILGFLAAIMSLFLT